MPSDAGTKLLALLLFVVAAPLTDALRMHWAYGVSVQSWGGLYVSWFLGLVVLVVLSLAMGRGRE